MSDIDSLANEIRRVDGSHDLGAGALAEALMPWLTAHDAEVRTAVLAEQGRHHPCRLPYSAPPCMTCKCGARATWDAARARVLREITAAQDRAERAEAVIEHARHESITGEGRSSVVLAVVREILASYGRPETFAERMARQSVEAMEAQKAENRTKWGATDE